MIITAAALEPKYAAFAVLNLLRSDPVRTVVIQFELNGVSALYVF